MIKTIQTTADSLNRQPADSQVYALSSKVGTMYILGALGMYYTQRFHPLSKSKHLFSLSISARDGPFAPEMCTSKPL